MPLATHRAFRLYCASPKERTRQEKDNAMRKTISIIILAISVVTLTLVWASNITNIQTILDGQEELQASHILDEWGRPKVPPGMVRIGSSHGMEHGGYYNKYFTVYDVSSNALAATPAWTPASLEPIPLPVHEAYTIFLEWQKTQPADNRGDKQHDRIELSNHAVSTVGYWYKGVESRWVYTITYKVNQRVMILLDGTLVPPRIIDLRTDDEKKEYEERIKNRGLHGCCP